MMAEVGDDAVELDDVRVVQFLPNLELSAEALMTTCSLAFSRASRYAGGYNIL